MHLTKQRLALNYRTGIIMRSFNRGTELVSWLFPCSISSKYTIKLHVCIAFNTRENIQEISLVCLRVIIVFCFFVVVVFFNFIMFSILDL